MGIFASNKEANYEFVTLCKGSNDTIKVDYLDSRHSISEIKENLNKDTLELKIFVSTSKRHKDYKISISKHVKFVKMENRNFEIQKLEPCPKVYSGDNALEQLKKMKN